MLLGRDALWRCSESRSSPYTEWSEARGSSSCWRGGSQFSCSPSLCERWSASDGREKHRGADSHNQKSLFSSKDFFFFNLAMLWLTIDSSVLFCFVLFLNTTRKFVKNISYWYRRRRREEDEATGNSSSQCAGEKKKKKREFFSKLQQILCGRWWCLIKF